MISAAILLVLSFGSPVAAEPACDGLAVLERAACEVRAAVGDPLCNPIDAGLQALLDDTLGRGADRLVAAASLPPRRQRRLVRRVDRALGRIARRAARFARRDLISTDCRVAIEGRIAQLRELLSAVGTPPALPAGLPDFVAGYGSWLRLNAAPIPPRVGGDPHLGTKNVFVNRTRDALAPGGTQRFPYPEGTIVVKEATRPGADFVSLVAVMRKRAGSDPQHGDWTFTEYTRAAASARFELAASDGVCFGCHGVAVATDWVYTRLE